MLAWQISVNRYIVMYSPVFCIDLSNSNTNTHCMENDDVFIVLRIKRKVVAI